MRARNAGKPNRKIHSLYFTFFNFSNICLLSICGLRWSDCCYKFKWYTATDVRNAKRSSVDPPAMQLQLYWYLMLFSQLCLGPPLRGLPLSETTSAIVEAKANLNLRSIHKRAFGSTLPERCHPERWHGGVIWPVAFLTILSLLAAGWTDKGQTGATVMAAPFRTVEKCYNH